MANLPKSNSSRAEAITWRKVAPFAIMSLVGLSVGVVLLYLMLWDAESIVALGLVGNVYYIVLVPLGLSVSAFLFGVFHSYAKYTGKQLGGKLELGGPIVAFLLVVVGGFWLPKPSEAFSVTVFVHGEVGEHDLLLRNSGEVWMTLGADLRQEKIGDKGLADFKNVPASFRGQKVNISVQADGLELSDPKKKYNLGSGIVEVIIQRKIVHLSGRILDTEGHSVTNATIQVGNVHTKVDESGHFTLTLRPIDDSLEVQGDVSAPGFEPWHSRFVPSGGEATIQLHHTP